MTHICIFISALVALVMFFLWAEGGYRVMVYRPTQIDLIVRRGPTGNSGFFEQKGNEIHMVCNGDDLGPVPYRKWCEK